MNADRQLETERLRRSWEQHDQAHLRNYLVASVEDPRLNVQSVLTRHLLLNQIFPGQFDALMREECRFAAALNSLRALGASSENVEVTQAVRHALQHGSDNAEGIQIPSFLVELFRSLPLRAGPVPVPNYLETFLTSKSSDNAELSTFQDLWRETLASVNPNQPPLSVLEPACGSANEYRFLHSFGITRFLDYFGFDLSDKNIANAREMFPGARFEIGNVFAIGVDDKSFQVCYAHDVLEHLSLEGLETAVAEICRTTCRTIGLGFFQMHEGPEHIVRTHEEYHWNTLSLPRVRELFTRHGFHGQAIHIGTFLAEEFGCAYTHNPDAYTLILSAGDLPG